MLKVENITTGYGKKRVLTDVSFSIDKSDVVLLSGVNGSGKSTALKTIYGLLKPWTSEGKVSFEGKEITASPVSAMICYGIVYMPQKKNVFEDFTVEENLLVSAGTYPKAKAKERADKVFEFLPVLKKMRKRTPFHLSGGEKQLLAFGNVLVHSPKLVLLDEPFAGVDIGNSEIFLERIYYLLKNNVSFIIVEHKKQLIEDVINKTVELELGTVKDTVL